MYEKEFAERLTKLREQRGISAREMSLQLGQNDSYINRLENKKSFPSMESFFYICEYLNITPAEFWDIDNKAPEKMQDLNKSLKKLDEKQLLHIQLIVDDILKDSI